jgi:hypothetical protein
LSDDFRLGEAKVDGDSYLPILFRLETPPADDITASSAEVERKGGRGAPSVRRQLTLGRFDMDLPSVITVRPQHTISATGCTIANGGIGDWTVECPTHCATETGPNDHDRIHSLAEHTTMASVSVYELAAFTIS